MLAPPVGSLPLPRWAWGPFSVPYRSGTPAYMLQAETKGKVCVHTLQCATAVLKPASLLRESSGTATCPRLQTLLLRLKGLRWLPRAQRLWTPLAIQEGSGTTMRPLAPDPCLTAKEGSSTDMRPSALDHTHLSGGLWYYTCPMALHGSWAIEEGLVATACSQARVFKRHPRALSRCLQDVWADDVIMNYKPYGQALQHRATVHHRADNRSQAWCYSVASCY
jgi:hypothetical protein